MSPLLGQFWNIPVTTQNYHTELRDDIKMTMTQISYT